VRAIEFEPDYIQAVADNTTWTFDESVYEDNKITASVTLTNCDFVAWETYELYIMLTDEKDYTTLGYGEVRKNNLLSNNFEFMGPVSPASNQIIEKPRLKIGTSPSADSASVSMKLRYNATVWMSVVPENMINSVTQSNIKTFQHHQGRGSPCFGDHFPRWVEQEMVVNNATGEIEPLETTMMLSGCGLPRGIDHVAFIYIEDEGAYYELKEAQDAGLNPAKTRYVKQNRNGAFFVLRPWTNPQADIAFVSATWDGENIVKNGFN